MMLGSDRNRRSRAQVYQQPNLDRLKVPVTQPIRKEAPEGPIKKHFSIREAAAPLLLTPFTWALALSVSLSYPFHGSLQASEDRVVPIQEVFEPATPLDQSRWAKVAVLQWAPPVAPINITKTRAEEVKRRNSERLRDYIDQAVQRGALMVVTPEMGVVGYPDIPELPSEEDNFRNRADIWPYLEQVPNGPTTQFFQDVARSRNIYLQFGLAEYDPKTDLLYNTAVLIDNEGRYVGKHRKKNLFELENNYFSPGTDNNVFMTPFGPIGLLICADVYDYSLLSYYRSQGVQVLNLSTSWARYNSGMSYFIRGAQRVGAYLLAANHPYFPDSGVVNPDGTLQSHIRQSNGLAYGYLPFASGVRR